MCCNRACCWQRGADEEYPARWLEKSGPGVHNATVTPWPA